MNREEQEDIDEQEREDQEEEAEQVVRQGAEGGEVATVEEEEVKTKPMPTTSGPYNYLAGALEVDAIAVSNNAGTGDVAGGCDPPHQAKNYHTDSVKQQYRCRTDNEESYNDAFGKSSNI